MSLSFQAAIRGDLIEWSKRQSKAVDSAVASVVRRRTTNLKNTIRRQIVSARLGDKLPLAVRGELKDNDTGKDITRRGNASDVTGRVWSKAIKKRSGSGIVDLITVWDTGATITARGEKWIALPTKIAGKRSTPETYKGGLIFKHRRGSPTAVLTFKARPNVVAFVLVKRVILKKRLRIASAYAKASAGLDDLIAREVERRVLRAAGKQFS